MSDFQDKDTNYVVQALLGELVVWSPKLLDELRLLPESSLNDTAALVEGVLGSHIGVDILLNGHLSSDICRGPLTKNLRKQKSASVVEDNQLTAIPRERTASDDRRTGPSYVRATCRKSHGSQRKNSVLNFLLQTAKHNDPDTLSSRMIFWTAAAVSDSLKPYFELYENHVEYAEVSYFIDGNSKGSLQPLYNTGVPRNIGIGGANRFA
ncbi:MAG: hypothetical protein Q9188_003637 [Gyalolechia gomerana]